MRKPDISVIIPTYNSAQTIEACLHSLLRQKFLGTYEIRVVDCSQDSTPALVRHFPRVALTVLPQRVNPGEARNAGIRQSKGDVIALIDSDCMAGEGWLETIRKNISTASVVGGSVDNSSRNLISWADHFLSFGEFLPGTARQRKDFVPTCNVAYRREVFKTFGYFPPDRRASEDVFFNTLISREEKIVFDPEVKVFHRSREKFSAYLRHQYLLGANAAGVRRQRKDIYGSFLARSELFGLLLPFIRTARISRRAFSSSKKLAYLYIASFPLIAIGLLAWSLGFSRMAGRKL